MKKDLRKNIPHYRKDGKNMKKLLLIFVLSLLFALTACGNEEAISADNFEYDPVTMVTLTRDQFEKYYMLSDIEREYYLNDGSKMDSAAASGFEMIQTTDHVGQFQNYDTSDGKVFIKDGNDDDILCTITAIYENRPVQFTVYYKENREFPVKMAELYKQLEETAAYYGYDDVATLITEMYQSTGYDTSTTTSFMTDVIKNEYKMLPYTPVDCEVTAVYSKSELLSNAGKNTAIGMLTVFCVLIFISIIIALLRFVPLMFDKNAREERRKQKEKEAAAAISAKETAKVEKSDDKKIEELPQKSPGSATAAIPAEKRAMLEALPESSRVAGDDELIAVITAAITAYNAENAVTRKAYTTASNDKLIVRSIRKVR